MGGLSKNPIKLEPRLGMGSGGCDSTRDLPAPLDLATAGVPSFGGVPQNTCSQLMWGLLGGEAARERQLSPTQPLQLGSSVALPCPRMDGQTDGRMDGWPEDYNPRQGAKCRGDAGTGSPRARCGVPAVTGGWGGGPGGDVEARGGASAFTHFVVKYLKGAVAAPERAP